MTNNNRILYPSKLSLRTPRFRLLSAVWFSYLCQKGLSQNVKTHSGSPRFLRKTNKKKNHRQNLTVEWTTKQRSVKNRPLLLYILLNFTKLSNHFFKQRPSEAIGIDSVTEFFNTGSSFGIIFSISNGKTT